MGLEPSFNSVLFVSGPIASGKTWTADGLASSVSGCARTSFSAGLRVLLEGNLFMDVPIATLQDAGHSVALSNWEDLWRVTVSLAAPRQARHLIVDGLRHVHIFESLRHRYGRVGLLVLAPGDSITAARTAARAEDTRMPDHPVETAYEALAERAHVVLRGEAAIVSDFVGLSRLFDWLWTDKMVG